MIPKVFLVSFYVLLGRLSSGVAVQNLYPFGPLHGHHELWKNDDDSSSEIYIGTAFPFSGAAYTSLYVNTNGLITFTGPIGQYIPDPLPLVNDSRAMIAAFWADVDIRYDGQVWYAAVTSQEILQRATNDVRDAFPDFSGFTANWTFVVTWKEVPVYPTNSHQGERNTFQAILITDGTYAFVRLIYKEITWANPAECGFNGGRYGGFAYSITRSANVSVFDLPYATNVKKNPKTGVWMFRVDDDQIEASGDGEVIKARKVRCHSKYMEVEMFKSLLPHVDWSYFHLSDVNCRVASHTQHEILLRAPLDGCGTTYSETNDMMKFGNVVKIDDRYDNNQSSVITRQGNIVMRFYCQYSRRQLVSTGFDPAKEIVHVSEGNFGNLTFWMHLFKSPTYTNIYFPFDYPVKVALNKRVWIKFGVTTTANLVVFADNCRATTSTNPNSSPKYPFLENGCRLDYSMVYNYNSRGPTQTFSIKTFRFAEDRASLVYLHCELLVCHLSSNNTRCDKGCTQSVSARRRRDTQQYEGTSKKYDLSIGPLKLENKETPKKDAEPQTDTVVGMTIGIGILGASLLVFVVKTVYTHYRSRRVNSAPIGNSELYVAGDDWSAATADNTASVSREAGNLKV